MIPELVPFLPIPEIRDPASLIRMAYEGRDLSSLIAQCEAGIAERVDSVQDWMDLGLLYQLTDNKEHALACHHQGLTLSRVFRNRLSAPPRLRLLAFVAPGDLMSNTPLDVLLEGQQVDIIRLFILPGEDLPVEIPDHDVAFVAIAEADHTKEILLQLATILPHWPRPVLNDPVAILELGRDRLFRLLDGADGVIIPATWRNTASQVAALGAEQLPLIIRPIASHAGDGLELLEHPDHIGQYLAQTKTDLFYMSPYINYSSGDGGFRKYRVAFFDGRPHLAHLAIGDYWMVHYLNAGMADDPDKRAEEAQVMATFDTGFAARHKAAFAELMRRVGLDYFVIDCAETKDGKLLIFEASVAMIIHSLDPESLYPYKKPAMFALSTAFRQRLEKAKRRAPEPATAA